MKKIHRFLITKPINDSSITIDDAEIVHLIKDVLKLSVGESCILFSDGTDDYLCKIENISKKSITLKVDSTIAKKNIPKNITACISITKRNNFELVAQKLTELGVRTIIPIISEHTIKQALRIDRLQKISDEALEQSGGSFRVHIHEPESLEESLIKRRGAYQCYFDMDGERFANPNETDLSFYIGPEGGWSDAEKNLFKQYGTKVYALGETTLRAETATIVAGYKLLWD